MSTRAPPQRCEAERSAPSRVCADTRQPCERWRVSKEGGSIAVRGLLWVSKLENDSKKYAPARRSKSTGPCDALSGNPTAHNLPDLTQLEASPPTLAWRKS